MDYEDIQESLVNLAQSRSTSEQIQKLVTEIDYKNQIINNLDFDIS